MRNRNLSMGAQGDPVNELKRRLNALKYRVASTNSLFDVHTELAVQNFQCDHGLLIDGVVDERTWRELEQAYAMLTGHAPREGTAKAYGECGCGGYIPELSGEDAPARVESTDTTLQINSSGDKVKELKRLLCKQGYLKPPNCDCNEYFDDATRHAVLDFQKRHGHEKTGVVEPKTWRELYNEYNHAAGLSELPTLKEGDNGALVCQIQIKLAILWLYSSCIDGVYGPETREAVGDLQHTFGLPATGAAGPETWRVIDSLLNDYPQRTDGDLPCYAPFTAGGMANCAAQSAHNGFFKDQDIFATQIKPTLKKGATGAYVAELQAVLQKTGFYAGALDGRFGPVTEAAVKVFQQAAGLKPDGIVGPATWATLAIPSCGADSYAEPGVPTLRQGASGYDVVELQTKLQNLGFYTGALDGRFGPATAMAVKVYQQVNDMSADGVVGPSTWAALSAPEEAHPVFNIPPTLSAGARGRDVTLLQTLLQNLGYYTGYVDGQFGPATKAAVQAFQQAAGLAPDGVAGPRTWAALQSEPEAPAASYGYPTIRQGSYGSDVVELQKALQALSYYNGAADGQFGPLTAEAVRHFQTDYRLETDGIAGPATWAMIDRALAQTPPPNDGIISRGAKGGAVKALQTTLKHLGYYSGHIDGIFGQETELAVKRFQQANGLTTDGVVGMETGAALESASALMPPGPPPTIKQGDSGAYVGLLQSKLLKLGYDAGPIDGQYGPNTRNAVVKFQSDYKLTQDGVVGPYTWSALKAAVPLDTTESNPVLRPGDKGPYVSALQEKLKTLGYFLGSVTGGYDNATEIAVKAFQRENGLAADGVVGPMTWAKINIPAAPLKEEPVNGETKPTLRYGDTGPYVRELQMTLQQLMYYNGPINGTFDESTLAAAKSFQYANRLTPDGIVGKMTWYALGSMCPPPVKQ